MALDWDKFWKEQKDEAAARAASGKKGQSKASARRDSGDDERGEDNERRPKRMTTKEVDDYNAKMRADGHRLWPKSDDESPQYTANRLKEEADIKAGRSDVGKPVAEQKKAKQQKTDAQAKTAKLGRKGKWKESQGGKGRAEVSKIAKEMKADGKTGWVTIGGAKINLG
jgi:hypothetical protein